MKPASARRSRSRRMRATRPRPSSRNRTPVVPWPARDRDPVADPGDRRCNELMGMVAAVLAGVLGILGFLSHGPLHASAAVDPLQQDHGAAVVEIRLRDSRGAEITGALHPALPWRTRPLGGY